jgi:TonB family protein
VVDCGAERRLFEVPTVHRRAVARNSKSLLALADLTDRLAAVDLWRVEAGDADTRAAGAAAMPRLLAGDFDTALPEPKVLRGLLAEYRGPQPIGRKHRVLWREPADLEPVELTLPVYPKIAVQARVQGRVRLDVWLDSATGDVRDVESVDEVPLLSIEAVKAARQWRFPAGTVGEPLRVVLEYVIEQCVPGGEPQEF